MNPYSNKVTYSPIDCLYEIPMVFGGKTNIKKTDLDYLPYMSAGAKISEIAVCSNNSGWISGIQLIWEDDGKKSKTSKIGQLSGIDQFTEMIQLEGAALASFEKYWFIEASPDSQEYYLNFRANDDAATKIANAFTASDANADGQLGWDEYQHFYYRLRLDQSASRLVQSESRFYDNQSTGTSTQNGVSNVPSIDQDLYYAQKNMIERMYMGWEAATAIANNPLYIEQVDWLNLEERMMWWFKAGKLDAVGDVYTDRSADPSDKVYLDSTTNNGIKSNCYTVALDSLDRVTMAMMDYDPYTLKGF